MAPLGPVPALKSSFLFAAMLRLTGLASGVEELVTTTYGFNVACVKRPFVTGSDLGVGTTLAVSDLLRKANV